MSSSCDSETHSCAPFLVSSEPPWITWTSLPGYSGVTLNPCWCTYPVHLHVLELQPKVIALDEVAPQENLSEEGLSKSFWLEETEKGTCYFHHHANREIHPAASTERDDALTKNKKKKQHKWWSQQGEEIWSVLSWSRISVGCLFGTCTSATVLCILWLPVFWLVPLTWISKRTKKGCCAFSVTRPWTGGSRKIRKRGQVYLLNARGFVFTKRGTNCYVLRTHCTWGLESEPVTFGENYSLKHLVVM